MNRGLSLMIGIVATALFAAGAAAQPGQPSLKAGGDCAKARDPGRCEALRMAQETCKDKAAAEKHPCVQNAMPPMDCGKARNPQRCEAHQKAKEICKDKIGREHRQCLRENMPRRGGQRGAAKP